MVEASMNNLLVARRSECEKLLKERIAKAQQLMEAVESAPQFQDAFAKFYFKKRALEVTTVIFPLGCFFFYILNLIGFS